MYLHSLCALGLETSNTIAADHGDNLWQELWQQVRGAFPGSPGSSFRLEQGGGDHILLIVDEIRAFRFPRAGTHGVDLEIKILEQLRGQAQIAIPNYDLVDPDGCFASYLLIAGSPLTRSRYARLPENVAQAAVAGAVLLLTSLHELDPGEIVSTNAWPRLSSPVQFVDWIESGCLTLLANRTPALGEPIKSFLERYRHDRAPRDVVLR